MAMDRERPRGNRKRRKVCTFCVDKVEHIDYKDSAKLKRFTSERSKILPRRHLCYASASADRGHQARSSDCSAALRHRLSTCFRFTNPKRAANPGLQRVFLPELERSPAYAPFDRLYRADCLSPLRQGG